ncbi:glutamate racemase [Myroides sp. LJL115]
MQNTDPIGLFDSGIGGTTIWRELITLLPCEDTIFLADQKNAPYGVKSKQVIVDLCMKNIDYLLSKNAKIIVIACNTATTNAVKELRNHYQVPIIGIEPAIKPATILTKTSKIGVLATKGTITSDLFTSTIKLYPQVEIIEQIGYDLVTLIESGQINSPQMTILLQQYLQPMVEKGIDTLVLGCTHYPYLKQQIQKVIPNNITIIDSGQAVAKQTKKILLDNGLLHPLTRIGEHTLLTNTDPTILKSFVKENATIRYEDF